MSNLWWEKTVEYLFIGLLAKELGEHWFAPLDGKHEKAGDLIAGDERWILIEFKRNKASILSERKKFGNGKYEKAKKSLEKSSGHHFIIYGEKANSELVLKSEGYFSNDSLEIITSDNLENILDKGVDLESFKKYLKMFTDAKGDGTNELIDFMVVMGVVIGCKKIICMPMKNFLNIKDFISLVKKENRKNPVGR